MNATRTMKVLAITGVVGVVGANSVWWALGGTGTNATAVVTYEPSDGSGPVLLSEGDAIAEAEKKVGYDVSVPEDVPNGFTLRSVHAEVGPVGPDQTGVVRDLSHIRLVTLVYRDGDDRSLRIEQQAPEGAVGAFAGARTVDAGQLGVKAAILERPGVTHQTWDSPDSTYVITLASRDGRVAVDSEAILLAVARSMR